MAPGTRRAALIIEDSSEDRFFIRRGLKSVDPDFEITEFSYVERAIAHLRRPNRSSLDLILVDINMPRLDGFEFADAFQGLYPELRGDARLYVMSSSIDPDDIERANKHPAISGFLKKPINRGALTRIIRGNS